MPRHLDKFGRCGTPHHRSNRAGRNDIPTPRAREARAPTSCRTVPSVALGAALFLVGFAFVTDAGPAPIPVPRDTPQLFVDDSRIAEAHGLQRTLHQPKKENAGRTPILALPAIDGHPATLEANGTIVFDSRLQRWVMYCVAFIPALDDHPTDGWKAVRILRYTSPDLMQWTSEGPDGVEIVYPRSREDLFDEVNQAYGTNVGACIVWYNEADPDWPYQGWIWREGIRNDRSGAYFWRSRDGRHFELGRQILVNRGQTLVVDGRTLRGPEDTSRVAYDPVSGRFLASLKFRSPTPDPHTGNHLRSRAFLFLDRLDEPVDASRITAIDLVPSLRQHAGDLPFDEYYDNTAYRYGSHWLGELRIWHGHGDYAWSAAGCAYLKLIASADGLHWRRVPWINDAGHPEVFIPNGPEGGNQGQNDGGYMTCFHQAPLRVGDELLFHYGASSWGKNAGPERRITGGGIFRARLRLDGFVSVDAGQLTTPLLAFEGDELLVNSTGSIAVALIDPEGAELARTQFSRDAVRGRVTWDGRSLREVLGDRRNARLRFIVEPGSALYSFLTR